MREGEEARRKKEEKKKRKKENEEVGPMMVDEVDLTRDFLYFDRDK
jgi:hypothetical protein